MNVQLLSMVQLSGVINTVQPWQVGNTQRWSLCTALQQGIPYHSITTATCSTFLTHLFIFYAFL